MVINHIALISLAVVEEQAVQESMELNTEDVTSHAHQESIALDAAAEP